MVKSAILNRKSQGLVCFALMLIGGVYQLFGSILWLLCRLNLQLMGSHMFMVIEKFVIGAVE